MQGVKELKKINGSVVVQEKKDTYNTRKGIVKALNNQSNELSEYSIDERLSDMLITKTLGEIAKLAQCTNHTKTEVVCTLIYNAVFGSVAEARAGIFNPDIGLMEEIIKRVDGSVPDAKERENFANIIGEALDDVMELPKEQAR